MGIRLTRETRRRRLTGASWLIILIAAAIAFFWVRSQLCSFLSPDYPIDAKVLVIEGWLPDYAVAQAAEAFKSDKDSLIISTGIPIEQGGLLWERKSYAQVGAATLKKLGVDSAAIVVVAATNVTTDRTYATACALRDWIIRSGRTIHSINLVSLGPHARRSWILFKKALGDEVEVGVLSYPDVTYSPGSWWKSSNGFRTVTDELIAYLYAKFVFLSGKHDDQL